ncbi:MFS family permease [Arthrobacter pigmenti]|uniref:MFS family permease n=1 Tax=Arthrobacter pigmenti TaxID=271432 RepID=A0A846RH05_9MICC|nr:MFS transporter [Arthrobacter pigmenti]NJC22518.1 MFS family permease [Arthrobacter pigmenti]
MSETTAPSQSLVRRNSNFRALWLSATVGVLGTAVASIALPIIAAVELAASDFAVAALAGMTFLPWLLLGLPIGVWVDRWPRKPVIVWSLIARILSLATLPVAYWFGMLTVVQLFVVAFVAGLSSVFFSLADQALVQQALTGDELVEGNGIITASGASADAAGRGIAGWLTVILGASNTLLVQVAASFASLFAISSLRLKEARPEPTQRHIFAEMMDGLRYTFSTAPLRAILFNAALWNLGGSMVASLMVLLVIRVLNESEIWLGLLMAATSIGGAVGGLNAKRLTEWLGSGPVWRWSMVPGVLGYASLLVMTPGPGMIIGLVGMFVMGVSVALNIVVGTSFRQRVCPPAMMGRLGAATRMVSWGMLGIASIIGGVLAELLGITNAILVGVVLTTAAPLVALFGSLRSVKRLEDLHREPVPSSP